MKTTVNILATVRNPALLPATLLVFKTLRTGFPAARVFVWGNGLCSHDCQAVRAAAASVGASFINLPATSHDAWIETMVNRWNEPLWICDTDMVFFHQVEAGPGQEAFGAGLFMGRHEPEFDEEWTGTRHMERLHTCLMWFNPVALRMAIRSWMARIPDPWRMSAQFPLFRQNFIPVRWWFNGQPETWFYDTCAGLYHALGGTPFSEEQNAAFEHLHCGTYADVMNAESLRDLPAVHAAVYQNPQSARGLRAGQDAYYATRKPKHALC